MVELQHIRKERWLFVMFRKKIQKSKHLHVYIRKKPGLLTSKENIKEEEKVFFWNRVSHLGHDGIHYVGQASLTFVRFWGLILGLQAWATVALWVSNTVINTMTERNLGIKGLFQLRTQVTDHPWAKLRQELKQSHRRALLYRLHLMVCLACFLI